MPKFTKQVRNFLNNSPFKMKGKSTLLKASKGNMVSPLKETEYAKTLKAARAAGMSQFDYNKKVKEEGSQMRTRVAQEEENRKRTAELKAKTAESNRKFAEKNSGQAVNETVKKQTDSKSDATGTKTETVTVPQRRAPGVGYSGPAGKNFGNTIRLKKDLAPTGKRDATKTPEKIASAEAIRTIEANRKILQNAKGQEKNMQDKNKLKADIKTLRKNKKGYTTGKGDTKSNKDLLNEKRQAKRKKGKAIREYKTDPNALKIDKVKKSSAAKMYKKKK
jgi:hypothetical protein